MATYTDTLGFNRGSASYPETGIRSVTKVSVTLDFAAITAARLAAGATALGAGDIIEVLPLPAKTMVLAAGVDVTTAEGAALTLDLGDGADPNGYLVGVDANAVASYANSLTLTEGAPNTVTGYGSGKYYAAADTIDLVTVAAADAAVVRVWALIVDCN